MSRAPTVCLLPHFGGLGLDFCGGDRAWADGLAAAAYGDKENLSAKQLQDYDLVGLYATGVLVGMAAAACLMSPVVAVLVLKGVFMNSLPLHAFSAHLLRQHMVPLLCMAAGCVCSGS